MHRLKLKDMEVTFKVIQKGIIRVRVSKSGEYYDSLLSKYNILSENIEETPVTYSDDGLSTDNCSIKLSDAGFVVCGPKQPATFAFSGYQGTEYKDAGFQLTASLADGERLFGLGDTERSGVARRGKIVSINLKNIAAYGPVPYIMSSNGWGMLLNCTYSSVFDCGKTQNDQMVISASKGQLDFYLFMPEKHSLKDLLALQAKITGTPILLPKFAYGYTFVMNTQANAESLLNECLRFRDKDISCDMIGLEPGWMETDYDTSIDKKFDEDRFRMLYWLPANQSRPGTFMYALRQMGFKLSLWLCQEYDLLYEEEKQLGMHHVENGEDGKISAEIEDTHLTDARYMDTITDRNVAWFEHLKKFCDNGVSAFKLDCAYQVNPHPDRLWGGKYLDDEVHNVYPAIYVKQMQKGFSEYTGRRAMINTSCIYAGSQRFAASWAGDTGGGIDTIVAMLNYGFVGHSNVTCDMSVTEIEGIHYGFLSPWSQQLNFAYWFQPWFLGDKLFEAMRYYSHLRSTLIPYIYSMAHQASETAVPIARSLSLMYPDRPEYDNIKNQYMLGDSMLVTAFNMNMTLPEGKWLDYFTGVEYEGDQSFKYDVPEGRGGGLFVKAGSVFCTNDYQRYIEEKIPETYHINVYPGADASFVLHEDDGITYDYREGGKATTLITMENTEGSRFDLTLQKRRGSFRGRNKGENALPHNADARTLPSYPEVSPMGDVTGFDVVIFNKAKKVTLDGQEIPFSFVDGKTVFGIDKNEHRNRNLTYHIEMA